MSVVLPLKKNTHSKNCEVERFLTMGLPSLQKWLDPSFIDDVIVVCPQTEIDDLKNRFRAHTSKFNIRIVSEEPILGSGKAVDCDGWYKQQLIKLASHQFVRSQYYMTMDSDLVLTKPLTQADIFCPKGIRMTLDRQRQHTDWWQASCKGLQLEDHKVYPNRNEWVMQVTPQVLITERVHGLCKHLRSLMGNLWKRKLLQQKFTEYTLYWTYCKVWGGREQYWIDPNGPKLLGNALWYALPENESLDRHVEKAFTDNHDYWFTLVQSNIQRYALSEIQEATSSWLK